MPGILSDRAIFAHSSYEDSKYVIFGVPFDRTCTFRKGTRYGPSGIREAFANFEPHLFDSGVDLEEIEIHDAGDLDVVHATPSEMVARVNEFSRKIISDGKFPILLGGEHSVSPGCATAFDGIGVLGIDAHADYYEEYASDKNNHACAMKRIVDKFGKDNVFWVGVRSIGRKELEGSSRMLNSYLISENGIEWAIGEIEKSLQASRLYLSLDIDGIDPAFAPGTGTPVPIGLKPIEVKKIINHFADKLIGFDLVEVSPPLDKGITANLAASLVMEVIAVTHKAGL